MAHDADTFRRLCEESTHLPNVFDFLSNAHKLTSREKVDVILVDQYFRWKRQQAIPVDQYLNRHPEIDAQLMVPVLVEEYGYLEQRGVAPDAHEFVARFEALDSDATALLRQELDVEVSGAVTSNGSSIEDAASPKREIGRYQVVCSIGQGAFGEVFLAKDPTLDRSVAIKVLSASRTDAGANPDELLREARVIAKLDHPQIVPVFDFGRTGDGDCFIVSKYIRGKDLRSELRKSIDHGEAAKIIATLADALHAAHRVGVIHRDVKPGNVILDESRQPHLLDFGLALRQHGDHSEGVYAGTPAYMSPEQERGEPVDGRTDLYSLGIVFYELLAGRRPFLSSDSGANDTFQSREPQPPRQFIESIPRELERICLKALACRPSDRYNTAGDFAEELQAWIDSSETMPVGDSQHSPNGDSKILTVSGGGLFSTAKDWIRRSFVRNRWWVVGSIAILIATVFTFDQLKWIDSRSALQRWSDTYLPEFARGYLTDGWNLKPDYESGYFYRSKPLLAEAQRADASVTSIAVKTTAPRFKPVQVSWSPQGDRLAVVTRRGQLRIYHWDGKVLTLRLVYRADTSNDWVRCFRWHPFDGSAAIATGRGIVIGTSSDRGDYDISLLIGKVYETSSIHCLVDKGRVLYVFGSKTGFRAWDPLTETIYEHFLPPSASNFSSTGLSNQFVFSAQQGDSDVTVEFWEAEWNANGIERRDEGSPKSHWTFSARRSMALESTGKSTETIVGLGHS